MSWYSFDEGLNHPKIPRELAESLVTGYNDVCQFMSSFVIQHGEFRKRTIVLALDGFTGVEWQRIVSGVEKFLKKEKLNTVAVNIVSCYKSPAEIKKMVKSCLNNDPHFGFAFKGKLRHFFNNVRLAELKAKIKDYRSKKNRKPSPDVVICYGCGAALPILRSLYDAVFYVDITRETLAGRIEKNEVLPLGVNDLPLSLHEKQICYVDLQVLNLHKRYILKLMDGYIDGNNTKKLKLFTRDSYNRILSLLAEYPFRIKPVYMSGVWGGQEMKKIRKLPKSMANCSFALEVIPHLQSLRIAVGDTEIEVSFYNFIWNQAEKILGKKGFRKFGEVFPITLNYDDTCQGGNLAIQNHPNGAYLRKHFNERMRRDESYYIVKTYPGAKTYHGIREETDLDELRKLSIRAEKKKIPFEHDRYINSWKSNPGDLLLIPAGTVHASGANQLVLEIDTDPCKTGAEYTFHIYDYLRPNVDGRLRGIHIKHAFNVLRPHRRTNWVARNLKQKPRLMRNGKDWAEYLLGRHRTMFYEVRRLEFAKKIHDDTKGKFHILTLVWGDSVSVRSQDYPKRKLVIKFTETVIIPSCLGKYSVVNSGNKICKLTKALLK